MGRVEELEENVGHANRLQRPAKGLRPEVEEILVTFARIDVNRPQLPQRVRMVWHHPDRVPTQPALPDLRNELAGHGVVGQVDRPVVICRVAGRHAPVVEKITVALPREGGAAPEVLPELIEGAMVVVAEGANRLWKRLRVRHLEE